MKVKLFYSYSRRDATYRNELHKHLAILKSNNLIEEWCDEEIDAGDDWNKEIENNMETSNIILLLFSSDFIASKSCEKEVKIAMRLRSYEKAIFIPIILRKCPWQDVRGIAKIQALPQDGKPINKWHDVDEAWQSVYEGIKKQVQNIRSQIKPKLKDEFIDELLKNPIHNCTLDKLFVYPDILDVSKPEQKLENNEVNSEKLKAIRDFKHKYILIEGEEQSGKTSLCNMLYLHYEGMGFYPIIIGGKDITGKADIKKIVNKTYQDQYVSTTGYWDLHKEKRILIIDDINAHSASNRNYIGFLKSIGANFAYAVIFIDKLSNLSDKSVDPNYLNFFNEYSMKSLGHKKRDELIKKCISNDENTEFNINDSKQAARLDRNTAHINTIIGSNIVPSYPIFIVSTFNEVELLAPYNMHHTSYGHCYHAMITILLYRHGIQAGDMEQYFNFLTELAYFMFCNGEKNISQNKLDMFFKRYKNQFHIGDKVVDNLVRASILISKSNMYSFHYVYIYYYFVAKYIADHIGDEKIKNRIAELMDGIHKKDNSNIIVFTTHHTKNEALLDNILLNAMSTFKDLTESTLATDEIKFIDALIKRLGAISLPADNHDVAIERNAQLEEQDKSQSDIDKMESNIEADDNPLLIEIRKSAKSMEIIGKIMKNQYGTFKKDRLTELFEKGQNVGLRLLRNFIQLVGDDATDLENFIKNYILKQNKELPKEQARKISEEIVAKLLYDIIFGWLYKIVISLGYDKLVDIADNVNDKTNSTASKLINLFIHSWHNKELDIDKLRSLYKEFGDDKNNIARYILKNIVSHHIYMHKVDYQKKQKISNILEFPMQKQMAIQSKIKPN